MNLLKSIAICLMMAGVAAAAPILTLQPSGMFSGSPGQVVPIQFTLTSDNDYWISVIAAITENETNPTLGFFEDLTYTQGGLSGIILGVNAPSFSGEFGTYTFDPAASIGATNIGTFWLFIERYSDDPLTCDNCLHDTSIVFADFTMQVVDVPEPGTVALCAGGLMLLAGLRRRRR